MDITYIGALLAGLISFLSPCVLPLVPPYLCFLGGTTFEQLSGEDASAQGVNTQVIFASMAFVLGFTTVFVALGATATLIGQLVAENLDILSKIAGVAIIIVGLHFLGIFKIPILYRDFRSQSNAAPVGLIGAYLVGIAFAFGWTPCIGPQLGAILSLAASEASVARGGLLLGIYAAGLGIPFLLAAMFLTQSMVLMNRMKKHMKMIERMMGALLLVVGIALVTGAYSSFSWWLLETFPALSMLG